MSPMLDNRFQARYSKLPIATYAISDPPHEKETLFCHLHYHKEFEVFAVTRGHCEFTVGSVTYRGEKGDIFLVPPYAPHGGYSMPGEAFAYFCSTFDLSILREDEFAGMFESGRLDLVRFISHTDPVCRDLYGIINSIYAQSEERQDSWEFIVRGQMLNLFGVLSQNGYVSDTDRTDLQCDFGLSVLEILRESYSEKITSADMAEKLSYSHGYFCRKFRETFSMSFRQYLTQYRLSKARLFLTKPGMSIGEVAEKVGYSSANFFIRQFQELYGCTPGQFQKTQRTEEAGEVQTAIFEHL